jgi:bla regulator protein BlaR1
MNPGQLQAVGNHLWQSTVFAIAAGLMTLALRKNRAAARYWLWLAASVKFLIPFSALAMVGAHFGRREPTRIMPPIAAAIERVSRPFTASSPAGSVTPSQPSPAPLIPAVLWSVWAIGFALLVACWWRRARRVRAALAAASPVEFGFPVQVMSSPGILAPGVFGVLRPVLLLPEGIAARLRPEELESVLAHELCHIRRRDNFTGALHMIVEALFWFHPLIWWLGARLIEERERACDEEVLRLGNQPEVYAEGILKICEHYWQSPLRCVSGVGGANLRKRIEEIMTHRHQVRLSAAQKMLLAAGATLAVALPLALGVMNAPLRAQTNWQAAAGGKMAFDVASIKPVAPEAVAYPPFPLDDGNAFTQTGGRFRAIFPLPAFIYFAYKIGPTPAQRQAMLAHLPRWVDSDRFLIEARAPANTTKDQFRLMMQALLADRFKLAVRFESREAPVYALSLIKAGKLGPNLRRHSEGPACPATANMDSPLADAKVFPSICGMYMFERMPDHMRGRWGGRNITMASLAGALAHVPFAGAPVDRPAVDETGLNGTFDFKVEYAPQPLTPMTGALQRPGEAARPAVTEVEPDPNGPTFLNGLHEQLGLKLTPAKGQVQILIIDHVERPSEN